VTIAVVQYNAGNIHSVSTALQRLGLVFEVTADPERLRAADRVIFPGVGEASTAMAYLRERGLDGILSSLTQPVLGVCLGLQLLCRYSSENDATCLGVIEADVVRFSKPRKVPHMGWSRVYHNQHPLFEDIEQGAYFYFVHSFRAEVTEATIATCTYEEEFAAGIAKRNFVGVQFHPEKSGEMGQRVLRNFSRWNR